MNKDAFDFIRNSLNRIADGIASSDGRYPVWDYRALMELINTLEGEYRKKMPGLGADYAYGFSDGYMTGQKNAHSQWIPCSERVPEEDEQVLVYLYDSPYIAWIDSNGEWNTEDFTLDKEEDREDEPIAWMPLPEPYEAERREG